MTANLMILQIMKSWIKVIILDQNFFKGDKLKEEGEEVFSSNESFREGVAILAEKKVWNLLLKMLKINLIRDVKNRDRSRDG